MIGLGIFFLKKMFVSCCYALTWRSRWIIKRKRRRRVIAQAATQTVYRRLRQGDAAGDWRRWHLTFLRAAWDSYFCLGLTVRWVVKESSQWFGFLGGLCRTGVVTMVTQPVSDLISGADQAQVLCGLFRRVFGMCIHCYTVSTCVCTHVLCHVM